jgi:hypothetical protein
MGGELIRVARGQLVGEIVVQVVAINVLGHIVLEHQSSLICTNHIGED